MIFASRTVWAARVVALMGLGVLLAGCGGPKYEGPQRAAVSGTVTLDGSPMPYGVITFVPVEQGKRASGMITDGAYSIPEEQGPNLGEYKVEIIGSEKPDEGGEDGEEGEEEEPDGSEEGDEDQGDMGDEEGGGPVLNAMVAPEFNIQTRLTATIAAGENTHDFAVTSP